MEEQQKDIIMNSIDSVAMASRDLNGIPVVAKSSYRAHIDSIAMASRVILMASPIFCGWCISRTSMIWRALALSWHGAWIKSRTN